VLRDTEDAHDATFDFGRGQNTGVGWSDPTFGGFQPPKDFVGSLQPSVWKKSPLAACFARAKRRETSDAMGGIKCRSSISNPQS